MLAASHHPRGELQELRLLREVLSQGHFGRRGPEVNSKGYPYVTAAHPENCIGCAICARMCPDAAIEVYK